MVTIESSVDVDSDNIVEGAGGSTIVSAAVPFGKGKVSETSPGVYFM